MQQSTVERARLLAQERLAGTPGRLAHVRGVVGAVERAADVLCSGDSRTLVTAAWLHDVGYAPSIRSTSFHPVDGAEFARDAGFPDVVVSLIAYHTGAVIEAVERGLSKRLAETSPPPGELLDVLTYADMTTGPDGVPITAEDRVAEILRRYPPTDPVHRSVARSAPDLLAAVRRVEGRLAAAGAVQPR